MSDAEETAGWAPTDIAGLSVRTDADGAPETVRASWRETDGTRRTRTVSVSKWGLRRALWEGCIALSEGGAASEPPHELFARAQAPFEEEIAAEIAAEEPDAREAAMASARERRSEANRERFDSPEAKMEREDDHLRAIERALFGG